MKNLFACTFAAAVLLTNQFSPCGAAVAADPPVKTDVDSKTDTISGSVAKVDVPVKTEQQISGISPKRWHKAVHEELIINAPPHIVWQSMEKQRTLDPACTSVRKGCKNGVVNVEQKFSFPSPFGSADCILDLAEKQDERVDYHLRESEDLKAMEGAWVLTPVDDGKATKLGLYSYVEPYMMIPRMITNALISYKAKRNLATVKRLAEKSM